MLSDRAALVTLVLDLRTSATTVASCAVRPLKPRLIDEAL